MKERTDQLEQITCPMVKNYLTILVQNLRANWQKINVIVRKCTKMGHQN